MLHINIICNEHIWLASEDKYLISRVYHEIGPRKHEFTHVACYKPVLGWVTSYVVGLNKISLCAKFPKGDRQVQGQSLQNLFVLISSLRVEVTRREADVCIVL